MSLTVEQRFVMLHHRFRTPNSWLALTVGSAQPIPLIGRWFTSNGHMFKRSCARPHCLATLGDWPPGPPTSWALADASWRAANGCSATGSANL